MISSARSTVCGYAFTLLCFMASSGWAFTMPRGQLIRPNIAPPHALPPDVAGDPDSARGYFYFWFFGGSGGAGIAVRQFPQQLDNFKRLFAISNEGTSTGGEVRNCVSLTSSRDTHSPANRQLVSPLCVSTRGTLLWATFKRF